MKQKILLTTAVLSVLLNQPLSAGQVTDTFSQGDLLTDTKMQGIKAAINDNDANVITNRANAANNSTNITINAGNITSNANLISTLHNNTSTVKPVTVCVPLTLSTPLTSPTVVDVVSGGVTVTVNSPGIIVVSANATLRAVAASGATAVDWAASLYVADKPSSSSGSTVSWEMPVGTLAGNYSSPAHVQGWFRADTPGTYTYYFTGALFQSSSITMSVDLSQLCAAFTPD